MSTADSLIGQQLDEYRLEALLGRGGMARVYRGLDVRLKRYAAIKVIDSPFRAESEYIVRFEREAQTIAQLEHPHIVRLYRYGEAKELLYMAMQYIEGADLATILESYHRNGELMPSEDTVRIIREACLALDYAHSKGVIHRDIKPSNMILDRSGHTYLADFGLSLLAEIGTRGEVFGTPHYMAPEQVVSSAGVVPQSDLYAVGVMLFEMFTGRLPFEAAEMMDVAMLHMTQPPPAPRTFRPDINPELEGVILKALSKKPEDRYPTGAALVKALERALHMAPASILRPPVTGPLSMADRVAAEMAAHPLPPLPAPVVAESQAADRRLATEQVAAPAPRPVAPPTPVPVPLTGPLETPRPSRSKVPLIAAGLGGLALLVVFFCLALYLVALAQDETAGEETAAATSVVVDSTAGDEEATPTRAPITTPVPVVETVPTTAGSDVYQLLLAMQGDDSLSVVNQGALPFPLEPLAFGGGGGDDDDEDEEATLEGTAWGVAMLQPGDCVTVWKEQGNPQPPNVSCNQVGERLEVNNRERFWRNEFAVFYDGERVGECGGNQQQCTVTIQVEND
jgi:predicted Ser/Thr protein kinase